MMGTSLLIVSATISALTWTYLLLGRGWFWRIRKLVLPSEAAAGIMGRVAVIVPARNEVEVIGRSIGSLLSQTGLEHIHIFLVDDGSDDGTAEAARMAAGKAGKDDCLTVIQGQPLPPGWTGKLWALHQGVQQARILGPRFYLFTDADIVHPADSIATLAALADGGAYDLASLMVRLRCQTVPERLLIPAFVFFFFKLYPPAWIASDRHATAGAAGGCILIHPQALEGADGLEAIRGEIIDDCALARAVKRSGGKVWLGLAGETASIRAYGSFANVGRMISRSAFNQLRHSTLLLLAALLGLAITYLLPPALLFSSQEIPVALGAGAWLAMTAAYLPMVRYYRLHPLWALTLPLAAIFYMGATAHSAVRYWSGQGGEWKGRVQDR